MGFKMIYWTPLSGLYLLWGSILEKKWKIWKNGHFSGRIWPDWGNTTRADMAVLGSIGLMVLERNCTCSDIQEGGFHIFSVRGYMCGPSFPTDRILLRTEFSYGPSSPTD